MNLKHEDFLTAFGLTNLQPIFHMSLPASERPFFLGQRSGRGVRSDRPECRLAHSL